MSTFTINITMHNCIQHPGGIYKQIQCRLSDTFRVNKSKNSKLTKLHSCDINSMTIPVKVVHLVGIIKGSMTSSGYSIFMLIN